MTPNGDKKDIFGFPRPSTFSERAALEGRPAQPPPLPAMVEPHPAPEKSAPETVGSVGQYQVAEDPDGYQSFRQSLEGVRRRLEEEGQPGARPEAMGETLAERIERLEIPPLFRCAVVQDFGDQDFEGGIAPHLVRHRAGADLSPRSLLIHGKNGRGKTHLAAALAILWGARWCSAPLFAVRVRATFSSNRTDTELDVLRRYIDPRCLVLDDITSINASDHARSTLLALLDQRIGYMRPTIVTCYQKIETVEKLDPSIASRLSGFEKVGLIGEDRRKA